MSYDDDGNGRGVAIALTRDWAHWHRPMATRLPGWRSAVLLCGLFMLGLSLAGLVHAQAVDVQNTLVSKGLPSDTGNGSSSPVALSSADGRYVLFSSMGGSFVSGIADFNEAQDVFLHDRTTQETVLVSRSVASATTTANGYSDPTSISADGEWVLFRSNARNLAPGVTDNDGNQDVFLYQRSTGEVSLVSRSSASATTPANYGSDSTAISANGEWVLFGSSATDLVSGVTDSNFVFSDVFLYQRSTGAISLVSRSAASAMATANNESTPVAISADGEWVLFHSRATDLVSGVTDSNGFDDVFLYQRSTGLVSQISRSAASVTTSANGPSLPAAISADGEWVLFRSEATNLVSGVTDSNGFPDVFLYQRSTGAVTLVSRSAASAMTTANSLSRPAAISPDGEWVLLQSNATDLMSGVTDSNGGFADVFLYQRSTGAMSLVSRSAASATITANSYSVPTSISADGEWVLFRSEATNLVPGVTDSNVSDEVFLYQRSTGAVSLVSRSAASATITANGFSEATAISADGDLVLFRSEATNLVDGVTDSNGFQDVFLYQHGTRTVSVVSRSVAPATTANEKSTPTAISADGEWVLVQSHATNLMPGVRDANGSVPDLFLYQRGTGAMRLVSRSAASATTTANGLSMPSAISADGEWVLFKSYATNLVSGVTDGNNILGDVFLYQRSTGAVSLVSRAAASATTTANSDSFPTAISADGEWVLFESSATNLVSGVTDANGFPDVFIYQRSTGVVSLVSRSAASAAASADGLSEPVAISADGEWVLFRSFATNLVSGVTDTNGNVDVFLYQRSTGVVRLVSRSAASATTTANGPSEPASISGDGEWVLFGSHATNLVSGVTDVHVTSDVFLYRRSTGTVSLVSRAAASPTTTGNHRSIATAISADGEWVLFSSYATNLVLGVTDRDSTDDVFLYQRSTGAMRLVSRSAASATTGNLDSDSGAISADGEWVLFRSSATNLVPGVTDSNGFADVFLYQRSTGAVRLISRAGSSATTTANRGSDPTAISADGRWVLYRSFAGDVVPGVVDGNSAEDAFLAGLVDPNRVFADGFESTPPATTTAPNAP